MMHGVSHQRRLIEPVKYYSLTISPHRVRLLAKVDRLLSRVITIGVVAVQ
jgi:hypothetical protein